MEFTGNINGAAAYFPQEAYVPRFMRGIQTGSRDQVAGP
jgi:hypothetical protein